MTKYWLVYVLKVLSDLGISNGRQSIVLSAKWLVVVTCVSTKIEDGGHFIPFDQTICRSKQKNGKRVV
jgi:hypothetical protein